LVEKSSWPCIHWNCCLRKLQNCNFVVRAWSNLNYVNWFLIPAQNGQNTFWCMYWTATFCEIGWKISLAMYTLKLLLAGASELQFCGSGMVKP
jgi:hypothetical protein